MHNSWFLFLSSILVALLFAIIPLPYWLTWFWPIWIIPVVLYWAVNNPHQFSLGVAWIIGIVLDGLFNTPIGEHALALTVISYFAIKMHRQFSVFPLLQQLFVMWLLVALYQFIHVWIQSLLGHSVVGWHYWPAIITTGLSWYLVRAILDRQQAKYHWS